MTAKLADFGLSAVIDPDRTHMSNYTRGTPFFIAPELITNRKATTASDIFSLGVVMWCLYCNNVPYVYGTDGQFRWNPAFPRFPPHAMVAFVMLAEQCLAREPSARPSAAEVLAKLKELQGVAKV